MKRLLLAACLSLVTGFGLFSALAKDTPNSAEQLREKLESALKADDTNAITSLFNSEGGTNDWKGSVGERERTIVFQTWALIQSRASSITLLPLPAGFRSAWTNEGTGIITRFNVNVVGMIQTKNETGSVRQVPYGNNSDGFYLAGIILEKIPGNHLSVLVMAGPDPNGA